MSKTTNECPKQQINVQNNESLKQKNIQSKNVQNNERMSIRKYFKLKTKESHYE